MQSTSQPSTTHKNHLFASSSVLDPRKSILPIFDDDNDLPSEPRSSYILDFDLPDFDSRLIPSPQFHAVVNGLYLDNNNNNNHKASTSPRPSIESLMPPRALGAQHAVDTKHQSFLELEADCSALQLDSEVIILTRPRTMSKLPSAYLHSPLPAPPPPSSSSRAPSPAPSATPRQMQMRMQPVQLNDPPVRGSTRYQRKAPPPQLQLKTSNYRRLSRRLSTQLQLESTTAYFVPVPHPASLRGAPSPTQQSVRSHTHTLTPISIKSFRLSYASSRCVGGGSNAGRIQFSTKELHRRRILKLQRTFGERVPLELVTVSPRRRRPTSRPLSIVSYRAPVFYPPFDANGNGTPMSGIVRDWTFDQIGPPSSGAEGLQGVLKLAVSRQTTKTVQSALRRSQVMLSRRSEVGDGAVPLSQVEEHVDEDRGDNSIWLDEDEQRSPPQPRKRASGRASGLLVFVNKRQSRQVQKSHMAEMRYDDGQVVHPVPATSVPVSRPVSNHYQYYQQQHHRSAPVLSDPARFGASAQAPSQAGPSRLATSSAAPFDVDAAFPHGGDFDSGSASRTSSPSMPAFRNADEIDDSDDSTDLHHHPLDVAMDLSPGSTPGQGGTPVPPPKTGAGAHSVGHTPSNSYASDGYAYGYQQAGGFLDVPEKIGSATRRRERRQGWSGEWNQPTIKDVIQKLRDI